MQKKDKKILLAIAAFGLIGTAAASSTLTVINHKVVKSGNKGVISYQDSEDLASQIQSSSNNYNSLDTEDFGIYDVYEGKKALKPNNVNCDLGTIYNKEP